MLELAGVSRWLDDAASGPRLRLLRDLLASALYSAEDLDRWHLTLPADLDRLVSSTGFREDRFSGGGAPVSGL